MKIFQVFKKPDKEKEKKKIEELQKEPLDKKDRFAMLFASFFTLFLPAVFILGAICVLALAIFGVFN